MAPQAGAARGGRLAAALAERDVLIGGGCTIPSPLVAEIVASIGFDYVSIDQQHGVMDNAVLLSMLQAVDARGPVPVTRVPANHPDMVMRALDFGAAAVIVPLVETPDEAAAAVAACRYPPDGLRSYGPVRAHLIAGSSEPEALGGVACIALVETRRGLDNVDAIAAVPGLDGIYVGPNDLALSLGLRRSEWPPSGDFLAALRAIGDACRRHGVAAGIGVSGPAPAAACIDLGFRMVGIGYDATHLASTLRDQLRRTRSEAGAGG